MSTRFDEARRAALLGDLLRQIRGRPTDLLDFEEVRHGLRLASLVDRGIHEVPLARIKGTLGRAREFNRAFLPREEALRQRWTEVEGLARGSRGFEPVHLYKVGEVYFVVDGHHRVSVARSVGAPAVEARVHEFLTSVELEGHETPGEIVRRRAHRDFLDATGLEPETPDEFRTTEASGPQRLLEHVNVHRYYLGTMHGREFGWEEAVASWRDTVYRPMIGLIRESAVMRDFPGRTETDLYLFVMDHLHRLRAEYGQHVEPGAAVRHLRFVRHLRRPWLARAWPWLARLLGRRGG